MLTVLLVLQVIVTVAMIIVILIQRSSSDGMAGLAGGGNSIMSGRASANLLTRITSVLAAAFIINSLVMAAMTARSGKSEKSIIDEIKIEPKAPTVPLAGAPDKIEPSHKDAEPAATGDASKKATLPENSDVAKIKNNTKKDSKPVVPIAE
jgi:preprotein translocase subunit SecG